MKTVKTAPAAPVFAKVIGTLASRSLRFSLAASVAVLMSACAGTSADRRAGSASAPHASLETSAETRRVWFGNLVDGQTVAGPVKVEMKAAGLIVEPAARGVRDGHGHFHILINVPTAKWPKAPNPIPFDEEHRHFGGGDTVTVLDLPPGEHTLTLQFATGDHVPYDPQIAQTIRIRVTGGE
jgi:hypothetical protein